jgi:site-specific DNA-methyltransferase (adenine-specific)
VTPYCEHGGITIWNTDALDFGLPRVDLLLTDPPYGLGIASQLFTGGRRRMEKMNWDESPIEDITPFVSVASDSVVWGGNYYSLPLTRCWLSWYKPDSPPSMADFELAWCSRDGNSKQFCYSIAATNGERVAHPTQKPLALIKWCLSLFPDARTVLDPFAGSGTTLVAAKAMGLRAVGIEIEERYCEIAAKRLSQEVFDFEVTA